MYSDVLGPPCTSIRTPSALITLSAIVHISRRRHEPARQRNQVLVGWQGPLEAKITWGGVCKSCSKSWVKICLRAAGIGICLIKICLPSDQNPYLGQAACSFQPNISRSCAAWKIMCFHAVLGDRRGYMSLVSLRKSKLYFSCAHASYHMGFAQKPSLCSL